jgi:DNA-binding YbaB/EbfC family protein
MGYGNLAKMAAQMQADMARAEKELTELQVEGSSGGGAVKVTATGKRDIVSIEIKPEVVDPDDVEMLQDMVLAAVVDALAQAKRAEEDRMARITGGLRIPGMG